MKSLDLLSLQTTEYPRLRSDLAYAKHLTDTKDHSKAAQCYKDIGRNFAKLKSYYFASEMYREASDVYERSGNFFGLIASQLAIYKISRLTNNVNDMASAYEKIGSCYRWYLSDFISATNYYLECARLHEDNQNYIAAFGKARLACECVEETNRTMLKKQAFSLATRTATKSNFPEKAGVYALKWLEVIVGSPKNWSNWN